MPQNSTSRLPSHSKKGLVWNLIQLLDQHIRSGTFKPGDKIPTEKQIIETYKVSRSVVREALASLKADGLLLSKQGIGVFVASPLSSRPFAIENDEICNLEAILHVQELRKSVEIEAAGLAALRRNEEQLSAITIACDNLEQVSQHPEGDSSVEDFAVHMAIAKATNNTYFEQFLSYLREQIMSGLNLKYHYSFIKTDSTYRTTALLEHRALLEAISLRDAELARHLMHEHLSHTQIHYQTLKQSI